ncbi:MAG: penicillin-binding protein, partial [Rhodospirillales bacterium]|nr:penicillin-binding protein [Rhodospirillales bacterium]
GLSQYNRATQASRQPGSSFKPYVYLTALERGVSPSQRFLDAPFVVNLGAAGEWRPGNYEMTFDGPVPLHVALEKSLNLVTVRVASEIGMSAIAKTAETFGVVDKMPLVLPAALGAVETTVLRQAAGYATFAEGGRKVVPTLIDSVQDRDGHVIWRAGGPTCQGCNDPARPPEVVDARPEIADPASVYQLVMMMQGVVQHGTGTPAAVGLTNRAIAGKTGTTQDFNDAWFVGYTPDVVTAVWMGFDNPATLGNNETGGALSGPVWNQFMKVALKDRPNLKFAVPPGVTVASWNAGGETAVDAFKPGQVPGASGPVDGVSQPADTAAAQAGAPGGAPHAAGVDSSLGGLY